MTILALVMLGMLAAFGVGVIAVKRDPIVIHDPVPVPKPKPVDKRR